jgi:lipid A 4'-phosphatase
MSVRADARARQGANGFVKAFNGIALSVGLLAGALFLLFPQIDLLVGGHFHLGGGRFVGKLHSAVEALRWVFIVFYFACIGTAVAGLALSRARRAWMGLLHPQWLFLAVCLGVGPGLVANVILKDQWGRARPKHVSEFGGAKAFTPVLVPAGQCRRACSFVSGEASSVFVPFYAAALVLPQWSVALAVAGSAG